MSEPCLWMKAGTSTGPMRRATVWDEARQKYVKSARLERIPQVGFHGDSLKNMRPSRPETRWIEVMKTSGDVINDPITHAAAVEATEDDIARAHRKYRDKGWVIAGTCPLREVIAGKLRQRHLISDACKPGAKCCEEDEIGRDAEGRKMPPCPHYLAELKARQGVQSARYHKEIAQHRSAEEKQLAAQAEGTAATRALAEAISRQAVAIAPVVATPEPEPPKGPAKK